MTNRSHPQVVANRPATRFAQKHFTGLVFVTAFCVYAATGDYVWQSIDVVAAEEPAWALATTGTLDLSQVPHFDLPWYVHHAGGIHSDRFPGAILFLVPGYWLADLVGFTGFSRAPGVLTAAAVAAFTVAVLHQVFAAILTPRQARLATLFVAFGTGTWTIAGHAPWSHTIGQLGVALVLLALSRGRDQVAALAGGLLTLTRPLEAVAVAVLGLTLAWQRRSWWTAVSFALLASPGVALLVLYNGVIFDSWGPSNGHELGGEVRPRVADLPVNILGTLLSPSRGLLFEYPFLVLVPLALGAVWSKASDWERSAALAGAGMLVAQLALNRYSGGDGFFGNRLVMEPLTYAAPVLARCTVEVMQGPHRPIMASLLAVGVLIHALGATMASWSWAEVPARGYSAPAAVVGMDPTVAPEDPLALEGPAP